MQIKNRGAFSTLTNTHKEFLSSLILEQVDFVVIGGYAMRYYGCNRGAKDLDLLVGYEKNNSDKLINVLVKHGDISVDKIKEKIYKPMVKIHCKDVELLTSIEGLQFNNVLNNSLIVELDDYSLPVMSVNELLVSKEISNRPEDQKDINYLKNYINEV